MKVFKWLFLAVILVVLAIGGGVVAMVYLVDWNDFRDTIQNQTKKHTGRDLTIAGDLRPSVFPWVGVSIGDITLQNAEGFGEQPFAKMGGADVKVELLPLLKKVVNVQTVEFQGLSLDLQRAADGTTNWDDLVNASASTTTEGDDNTTEVEVEGDAAAIAALAVGGITISDANVSWNDAQSGTDAKLTGFNLQTGAIELAKPFDLQTDFKLASNSMGLSADMSGSGDVTLDLDKQVYSLNGFKMNTTALGKSLPNEKLNVLLAADVMANLAEQSVGVKSLALDALGLRLNGQVNVNNLDTNPTVSGQLNSDEFSVLEVFNTLGIAAPVTADANVLQKASVSVNLNASANSARLDDLVIKLDDTTFSGNASVPSLAGSVPPLRFDFAVDAIDLDRYLPPATEPTGEAGTTTPTASSSTGDEPIELPLELLRSLDVQGEFRVGDVKVKNLTTRDIVVPVNATNGRINLNGVQASLYEGQLIANVGLRANDTPSYRVNAALDGIQADPLLADLLQKSSFLSGKGGFNLDLNTSGNSVNALTTALNGGYSSSFNDGSINGVNVAYQIRRAKAALSGQSLPEDQSQLKTDFTELSMSGQFTNGVMTSNDLDMRSPLLRIGGEGAVNLPNEFVDYTVTTLITGSSQGQGGKDLEALKGVKLDIPIRGKFDELSANFAGVIARGLKDNIANNLKGQAEARARAEAEKLKKEAQARLKAEEEKARARLAEEEAKARQKIEEQKAKAQEKLNAEKAAAEDKAKAVLEENKGKLEDSLKGLFK